jgi:hypothetical protein
MLAICRRVVGSGLQDMKEHKVTDPRDFVDAPNGPLGMGRKIGGEEDPGEHHNRVASLFLKRVGIITVRIRGCGEGI